MRIITGRAKGLRLKTPAGLSTRPTSDRVKESLFSILSGLITFEEVEAVLDVFAGTGALGLEALSRGARAATFIDAATTNIIAENIARTRFEGCRNLRGDFAKIMRRLGKEGAQFDLIFSDPPYSRGLAQTSLNLAAEEDLLKAGGLIVIEHGAREALDLPPSFELIRAVTYGHTSAIGIVERKQS